LNNNTDITIIGAGITGLACALAIAKKNDLTITIIDANELPTKSKHNEASHNFDLRVSALTPASQKLLQNLNAWEPESTIQQRATPYNHMHVWDASGNGEIHFDAAEIGEPNLGFIVENNLIINSLYNQLQKHENVDLKYTTKPTYITKPTNITQSQTNQHLTLTYETLNASDPQNLTTNLIIGADGANSWVRSQTKIQFNQRPYNHNAIVATIKTELPHQNTAWQRFLPTVEGKT